MGKNWITTVGGILTAVGASLITQEDPTLRLIGQVLSVLGPLVLGWAAKQYNVTGGSIPQASPPGVALKSDALGVVAAVDAIKVPSYEEVRVKEMAEEVLAAPSTIETTLKPKEGC